MPTFAADIKGLTLDEILTRWFQGRDADRTAACKLLVDYEAEMEYRYIRGARELLESLRAAGVPTALVTSSNMAKMERVYAARPELKTLFTCVVTAEDVRHCKPSPEPFLIAAERLGVATSDCVVFEDSLNGLRAARASGAYVVGLTTTTPADIVAALSDRCLADFDGFLLPQFFELR